MNSIVEFLTIIGAFAAIGAVMDQFSLMRQRRTIARYIFGSRKVRFKDFETSFIRLLMLPFLTRETQRLKFHYIFGLSLCISTAVFSWMFLTHPFGPYADLLPLVVIWGSIASLPADYLSFAVTRALFFSGSLKRVPVPIKILIDLAVSLTFVLVYFKFLFVLADARFMRPLELPNPVSVLEIDLFLLPLALMTIGEWDIQFEVPPYVQRAALWAAFGVPAAFYGAIIITLAQLAGTVSALLLRGVSLASHFSLHIAARSAVRRYPLTYVSVVVGLLFAIANGL